MALLNKHAGLVILYIRTQSQREMVIDVLHMHLGQYRADKTQK